MPFPKLPELPGVKHNFVNVKGIKLHVAEAGHGKPLLLIHGWPQHWFVWRKIIPLLSDKYRLIMPDLPGFGWSEAPQNFDYNKGQLASFMISLVDTLNLKQVGLIGHDWGGFIGFLACLQEPEKFNKFLALGIVHPFQQLDLRILESWKLNYQIQIAMPFFGELLLKNGSTYLKKTMQKYSSNPNTWTEEELNCFLDVIKQPSVAHASSLIYRTFRNKEMLPIMFGKYKNQKLQVPTKLLIGEKDPVIRPSFIKGFEPYVDNMQVEYLKNCGHFIPEEMPDLVVKEIKSFFRT